MPVTMIMVGAAAAVLLLFLVWLVSAQRGLVRLDENMNNALNQIQVQTQSRFDSLTAINNLVKRYDIHEADTIEKIIAERGRSQRGAEDANAALTAVDTALGRINALAEQYPELKADRNYQQAMTSVNEREDQVRVSRMVYNDCATKLNRQIRMFPTSVVAGMLGFRQCAYLTMDPAGGEAVKME